MESAVCVFCASNLGSHSDYAEAAAALGRSLAREGRTIVYGGGKRGLMGVLADAALAEGGRVVGVIPEALRDLELAHPGVSEMIVTPGMHERKATMARLSNAFVALPGGFGTLEEIVEVITHRQLDFHDKPCILVNLRGYFDPLIAMFERAFDEEFAPQSTRDHYRVVNTTDAVLDCIREPGTEIIE
jgi:uncharacterized protein (TIGR00730 family)